MTNPAKTAADYLVGNWVAMASSNCAYLVDFSADGNYSRGTVCTLDDGTNALSVEIGTYYVTGTRIVWMSTKSTCSERSTMPFGVDFSVTATALNMSYSDALVVYARNPSTGSSNGLVATYGCFRNGTFTPSPLAPLLLGTGGAVGTGGKLGTGGVASTGGVVGTGGVAGRGGAVGTGGVASTGGVVGTGGTGTGGNASIDVARYNFESTTQGWGNSLISTDTAFSSVYLSTAQHFAGASSLAGTITNSPAGASTSYYLELLTSPNISAPDFIIPAMTSITFHAFVPVGAPISQMAASVQEGPSAPTIDRSTITAVLVVPGTWTTIRVTLPADVTPILRLGVIFITTDKWTGAVYVDSVNW